MEHFFGFQGKFDKAAPLYKEAIRTWKKVHGEEHPFVATGLNNLALVYKAQVQFLAYFRSITAPRYGAFFRFLG